jgi:hypothetical protein
MLTTAFIKIMWPMRLSPEICFKAASYFIGSSHCMLQEQLQHISPKEENGYNVSLSNDLMLYLKKQNSP